MMEAKKRKRGFGEEDLESIRPKRINHISPPKRDALNLSTRKELDNSGPTTLFANMSTTPPLLTGTTSKPTLTLLTLPQPIRMKIWQLCFLDFSRQSWKQVPGTPSECHQSFPEGAAQKNEVQLLRVNTQTYGECSMLMYNKLSVIISGQDFVFDPIIIDPNPRGPQGQPLLSNHFCDGEDIAERRQAKLSMLLGKSRDCPDYGSLCVYAKRVEIMIDAVQYEDDSIFPDSNGRQPFPNPEHKHLFDRDEIVCGRVNNDSSNRKQGRVSIGTILMENLCRFLRNSRPDLDSISIDIGSGIKTLKWQKADFQAKKSYTPCDFIRKKAHLRETLAPLMTVFGFKPLEIGLALAKHLQGLSEEDENYLRGLTDHKREYRRQAIKRICAEAWVDAPEDALVDCKDSFAEIHREAQEIAKYRDGDLGQIVHALADSVQSFLPYASTGKFTPSYWINRFYEFDQWVYDDIQAIKYLLDRDQPCLVTIGAFFYRICSELSSRMVGIRLAASKFAANNNILSLAIFLLAFKPGNLDCILYPEYGSKRLIRLENGDFDRADALRELIRVREEPGLVSTTNTIFQRLRNDLEQHLSRIEERWNALEQYKFILSYRVSEFKKVKSPPVGISTTEWTPGIGIKKRSDRDDEIERLKLARTVKLDAEIQDAVARGDSLTAWLRFQVLKLNESFRPDLVPPKPLATIPVQKFKAIADPRSQTDIDAEWLAKGKLIAAEELAEDIANGYRPGPDDAVESDEELIVKAKSRAVTQLAADEALREEHRQELIAAGYGYDAYTSAEWKKAVE